jgi:hypothetical protein
VLTANALAEQQLSVGYCIIKPPEIKFRASASDVMATPNVAA